jgi:hypothetical protein
LFLRQNSFVSAAGMFETHWQCQQRFFKKKTSILGYVFFVSIRPIFSQNPSGKFKRPSVFRRKAGGFYESTQRDRRRMMITSPRCFFKILIQTTEINWKRHTSTLDRGWGNIDAASTFIGGYKPKRCAIPVGV